MIDKKNNPDYVNEFLDYTITILNKSPNTIKEYNYDIATFLRFLKVHLGYCSQENFKNIEYKDVTIQDLKTVTLQDLHSFLAFLTINYKSKSATRARKVATLRVFFSYLCNKVNLLEKNPAQMLETPKQDTRLPKYLTLEDSRKLLNVTENEDSKFAKRDFCIMTLFLNCGLRLSELVGINIKDIQFDEYKLSVIGKGNKERTIYLNKACIDSINDYLQERPKDNIKPTKNSKEALFLSSRCERISNRAVQYIVEKELKRAGLDTNKYSTHKLRHTAATLMYQYGNVDIRALQELLGHETIATTQIYTHVNNEMVRDAIERNPLGNSDETEDKDNGK